MAGPHMPPGWSCQAQSSPASSLKGTTHLDISCVALVGLIRGSEATNRLFVRSPADHCGQFSAPSTQHTVQQAIASPSNTVVCMPADWGVRLFAVGAAGVTSVSGVFSLDNHAECSTKQANKTYPHFLSGRDGDQQAG